MPLVGDPIDPADYSAALATLTARADAKDSQAMGILAALVARFAALNVTLPGRGGTINGNSTNLVRQVGTFTGTTDGIGQVTINYPTSFPHDILIVQAMNGDVAAAKFVCGLSTVNGTGFVLKCMDFAGADLVSTSVRIDWTADGW